MEAQPAKTVVKALIVALFFALLAGADALALPRAVVAGRPRAACVRQHNPLNMHASSGEDHVRRTTEQHYKDMRQHQCLHYQRQMEDEWLQFNKARELTIKQALDMMDTFVDKSDPATSLPTVHHMMQVAETMRCCGEPDWMQLVGLIHDLGHVMAFLSPSEANGQTCDGPQWGQAGGTWVVGAKIPSSVEFPRFNALNPDSEHSVYGTEQGWYADACGLDALSFTWGHNEYLYRVLVHNKATIPQAGLDMIRLHSCRPLHCSDAYDCLLKKGDRERLAWVQHFNKYDEVAKGERLDLAHLWPYYQTIVDKYAPGKLHW